jgi:hypothetical protein
MHENRVPVHGVAVSELAGEDTEAREHNSSARVQERQDREAHDKGASERIDVDRGGRTDDPGKKRCRSRVCGQGSLLG